MSNLLNTQVVNLNGLAAGFEYEPIIAEPNQFDTMTIKSLSYISANDTERIFLLWCSQTGSYVSSFCLSTKRASLLPNIEIKLNRSNPNVTFRLAYLDSGNDPVAVTDGFMALTLEFTKYKTQ